MKSMTGFGTAEASVGRGRLFIEIKSINHRFCEVLVKLPGKMGSLDGPIRREMQKRFHRGKIEVFLKEKSPLFGGMKLSLDLELAHSYQAAFRKLSKALGESSKRSFLDQANFDRFIVAEERDGSYERLWASISRLMRRAAVQVERMRTTEGRHLEKDQRRRLIHIKKLVEKIERQSSRAFDQHVHRMKQNMATGSGPSRDESRLHEEAAYLVGRQDIAEELTRLLSHVHQYEKLLNGSGAVGRKLDFLLQEMHREINTIGAKGADASISQHVVECKAELERLREQVQNVE